ncbi:SPW repeat protein [Alicyclobacillus contaminans]|uniref:SPW repeat protein n=1 Tax=Alicyclobacillus contaminans TaxID=392016 RepID=UPI00047C285F|nr:SPW repeat protein [Alicyclobacillus contaminans]
MKERNWVCAGLGLWLTVLPWVLDFGGQRRAATGHLIGGIVLTVAAIAAALHPRVDVQKWYAIPLFLCGMWFATAQAFLGHYSIAQFWSTVWPGIIVVGIALWTWMQFNRFLEGRNPPDGR